MPALAATTAAAAGPPPLYTQVCAACHVAGVANAPKLGDKAAAKANYEKLFALAGGSNSDRAEIAAARNFVAVN